MEKGMGSTPVVLPGVNFYFTNFPVKERLQSIANCEVGEAPLLSLNQVIWNPKHRQDGSLSRKSFNFLKNVFQTGDNALSPIDGI